MRVTKDIEEDVKEAVLNHIDFLKDFRKHSVTKNDMESVLTVDCILHELKRDFGDWTIK